MERSVPLKLEANIYKDLAHVMAKLGVVTLRFDKRGVGKSDGDIMKTGMWDLVSDIESTITYLKEQPFVDQKISFWLVIVKDVCWQL